MKMKINDLTSSDDRSFCFISWKAQLGNDKL